ncbi:MAG TPA: ZIP family metal transporter [Burkholderiales bacterium]|jgi:zinc and cadmium transporter|nr:ZIP family metal transporter [Burkholderiales bacterium]
MPVLAWIVAATLLGGVLSVFAAAVLALRAGPRQLPTLVSYAIGTLLGAAFLEILPHALELAPSAKHVSVTVLIGILLFFVLEKLVLWRHSHEGQREPHASRHGPNDHGRIAAMVIIGDTFHNCVDGVIIAGAFLVSTELGIITALAIITHEVPQEVGDFLVLLHSGYSKRQALGFNLIASGAMVVGGVGAYFALQTAHTLIPPLLGIAAASMLYISIADLIPMLRGRPGVMVTVKQVLLIAAGSGTIWLVGTLAAVIAGV